jgi:hypothetical protein
MIKSIFLSICILIASISQAQKPVITWGEDFKLKKGNDDLRLIFSDNSGVYLQEDHAVMKSYFLIGASFRLAASIVKLDKQLQEVYRNDFSRELKGKDFETFYVYQNRLLLIASEYHKSDKTLDVYASEVDKSTGELNQSWTLLTTFSKEEKNQDIDFKIIPNTDSSKMVMVSTVTGNERNTYQIQEFDKNLKASGRPTIISNEFERKTFQLEDLLYTGDNKIILVGRVFEYREGKKKKDKFLDFSNYNIRIYDDKGKQVNEINTNINGRWLASTRLMLAKGKDLVLASFYSKERRGATNGLLVQRIDPNTGKVLSTTEKEINYSLVTADAVDDDDDNTGMSKAERKEAEKLAKIQDEGEAFSRYLRFRNIFYTADNGLVLLAEEYHQYYRTYTQYVSNGTRGGYTTTSTQYFYECGDMMMCKVDANNNIGWLQVIPKFQREVSATGNGSTDQSVSNSFTSFFEQGQRPYYAGFGALQAKGQINIFFNDHAKNADVVQPGQKFRRTLYFERTDCFVVSLDEITGKYQRKVLFSNTDGPTAMPRVGSVVGQEFYIVGKEPRMMGKTKLAVGKIRVN